MPPWMIVSFFVIIGFAWLADRLVLVPRAETVVVNGRVHMVRRRRDALLMSAAVFGLFTVVVGVNAAVEEDIFLLPPAVFFLVGAMGCLWLARGAQKAVPSVEHVQTAVSINRDVWTLVAITSLQITCDVAASLTAGVVSGLFSIGAIVSATVAIWLSVRFIRSLKRRRDEG